MAGNFQNLEIGAEKISAGRLFDKEIWFRCLNLEFETEVAKKFGVGNHRRSKRVATNWTTKLALNPGNVLNVIDMAMCQEQEVEIDLERTQPFASALRRVEEDPALWRFDQIGIRFENSAAKAFVSHCNLPCLKVGYG